LPEGSNLLGSSFGYLDSSEEQINAEGNCRYRGRLFEQEGRTQKRTC
jgi:hypothetical protein